MPRSVNSETGLNLNEKALLVAMVADNNAIRTAMGVLLAKLDADATVTDTNYAALCTPAVATVTS